MCSTDCSGSFWSPPGSYWWGGILDAALQMWRFQLTMTNWYFATCLQSSAMNWDIFAWIWKGSCRSAPLLYYVSVFIYSVSPQTVADTQTAAAYWQTVPTPVCCTDHFLSHTRTPRFDFLSRCELVFIWLTGNLRWHRWSADIEIWSQWTYDEGKNIRSHGVLSEDCSPWAPPRANGRVMIVASSHAQVNELLSRWTEDAARSPSVEWSRQGSWAVELYWLSRR